ncbi:hypothetical protein [Flavobacterium sp. LC2016-01]|uniref:hypothetical protein n=1 Tax=Flavobacterium sp. LC2016-01 TaxID=2675876 RepID=UPI0012BA597F|nr:hypothetical protein [Flavobacterium sp. LC2016-01]MTH17045.1 hypothetical protein [Flavobacterium sp. LC2016-01]
MSRRNKNGKQKRKKNESVILILRLLMIPITFVCFIFSARQYNNFTIINFSYLLSICVLSGLLFGGLMLKYEKRMGGKNFEIGGYFLRCILVYGLICSSAFFVLNESLSNNKEYKQESLIFEKHEAYKRSPNYIVVEIEGAERDINIHDYSYAEIAMAKAAEIKLKKGFFGFILIKEVKLKY